MRLITTEIGRNRAFNSSVIIDAEASRLFLVKWTRATKDDEISLHVWHRTLENMHFGVNKIAFAILLYQCLTICAGDDEGTYDAQSIIGASRYSRIYVYTCIYR